MDFIEQMRSGELHMMAFLVYSIMIVITPLCLLTAYFKKRLHVGMIILSIIPFVNLYTLFFLLFASKKEQKS